MNPLFWLMYWALYFWGPGPICAPAPTPPGGDPTWVCRAPLDGGSWYTATDDGPGPLGPNSEIQWT